MIRSGPCHSSNLIIKCKVPFMNIVTWYIHFNIPNLTFSWLDQPTNNPKVILQNVINFFQVEPNTKKASSFTILQTSSYFSEKESIYKVVDVSDYNSEQNRIQMKQT